jgi:pimeloyl-ACP methyl ester carboxylesterase
MKLNVNGDSVYVHTGGKTIDPNKKSVLFVHGVGMDHTVWTLPARHFARHGMNVLSMDLPGHGRSQGQPPESIQSMADAVIGTLNSAAVDRACLVGHSMGSLVALDAAGRNPDRVESLSLLGTSAPMAVADPLLNAAKENSHVAIDMLTLWGYSKRAQLGGNDTPGMWMVTGTQRLFERAAPGVIHNDLNACNEYTAGMAVASQVRCATIIILGDSDVMTPPLRAEKVAAVIEDCRIIRLANCGHAMTSEHPDAVLDALRGNILP